MSPTRTSTPAERPRTRRTDDDPVREYPKRRQVAYWTGGVVSEGRRVFVRPRRGQSVAELAEQLRRDLGTPSLDKGGRTLLQLFRAWVEARPADHPTTGKVKGNANNHVLPLIGMVRCRDLTLGDLLEVVDAALAKDLAENTVRSIIGSLGTVVTWGENRGWFGSEHPFGPAKVRQAAVESSLRAHYDAQLTEEPLDSYELDEVPTPAQVEQLAQLFDLYLDGAGHHIRVLAASGVRIAEYAALRIEDVDLERMQIKLRRQGRRNCDWTPAAPDQAGDGAWTSRLKGRRRRVVQVWESARPSLEWLVEHAEDGWLVPPSDGQAKWLDALNRAINGGCAALGWEDRKRCHWLRHFYGTYCVTAEPTGYGFDVRDVSSWMGHRDVATTEKMYLHKTAGADERARQASARKLV